jgi:dTDP-4-dehydrorhamnose reductase
MGCFISGGKMRVLVVGASGIVGSTMRLCVPDGVEPTWVRKESDPITVGCDLTQVDDIALLLKRFDPEVIVNLAGNSSVDEVERDLRASDWINIHVPFILAKWCFENQRRLIQISSQAVYSGENPPYVLDAHQAPINEYGKQKSLAEYWVREYGQQVIRLTFVLGIRPLPHVGRMNPLEAMIAGQSPQVCDRYFSPLMAWDAASAIWGEVVGEQPRDSVVQVGMPESTSRYEIASLIYSSAKPCYHDDFPGLAARPKNTTYKADGKLSLGTLRDGIKRARLTAQHDRDIELALFFGMKLEDANTKLSQGFGPLHADVSEQWRLADPKTEEQMLAFYRTTEAYIWELSAYHTDEGFNYGGMVQGIAARLAAEPNYYQVLCLGDGIGDLTLGLDRAGFSPCYHDLAESRTAEYAAFRFWRQTGRYMEMALTDDFDTVTFYPQDAVVSLDYLEHVPNVEEWVRAIYATLRPGGLFCAQNAFNCGSGPDGAIPMHLSCNEHWEKDWDNLLAEVGFEQLAPNWYRRQA